MLSRINLCCLCVRQWHYRDGTMLAAPRVAAIAFTMPRFRSYAQTKNDDLDYFRQQPVVGNLNSNPYEHQMALRSRWPKNENSRRLNVAVLGIPNSGKSTLINKLIGQEVCAASSKHNTTRLNARAILNSGDVQVVFLDTPGVVDLDTAKKFKLEETLLTHPEESCLQADLLLVLHDVSNRYVREALDKKILRLLCLYHTKVPSVLVLNKMDTIPRSRRIYDLIRKLTCNRLEQGESQISISKKDSKWSVESYLKRKERLGGSAEQCEHESVEEAKVDNPAKVLELAKAGNLTEEQVSSLLQGMLGWPGFRDVFTISAVEGVGVEDLKRYLLDYAKPGRHRFPSSVVTDVDPRQAVTRIIKAKLLDHLEQALPYSLNPEIEVWEVEPETDRLKILASVTTKSKREAGIVIGQGGSRVKQIVSATEEALRSFFSHEVSFQLTVISPAENNTQTDTPTRPNSDKSATPMYFM